jgi:hypothetical protein
MSQESTPSDIGDNEKEMDLSELQIRKALRSQFNSEARKRIEDLQEERALKRLLDDDDYYY